VKDRFDYGRGKLPVPDVLRDAGLTPGIFAPNSLRVRFRW
jgi:hypothetical protein